MKNLLTLNAGALKAISQIAILQKLEERIKKPVHEIFDFVSGTSAGGINAALIAKGYSADEIADIYLNPSNKLFKVRVRLWRSIFQKRKYAKIIRKYVPDSFLLVDVKVPLILFSQNIEDGCNYVFSSLQNTNLRLSKAIFRTTSIPPFLEMEDKKWLDPGMGALFNPTEATLRYLNYKGEDWKNIRVVNVESPLDPRKNLYNKRRHPGLRVQIAHAIENIFADLARRAHVSIHYNFPELTYLSCSFTNTRSFDPFNFKDLVALYEEAVEAAPPLVDKIQFFLGY